MWTEYDSLEFVTNMGVNFVPLTGDSLTGKSIAVSYAYPSTNEQSSSNSKTVARGSSGSGSSSVVCNSGKVKTFF